MKGLIIVIFLLIGFDSIAQVPVKSVKNLEKSDSFAIPARKFFPEYYGEKKWKILVGFDASRSFFAGHPVKINGLRIGATFKGVHRFGIGFYGLQKNVLFEDIPVNEPDATDTSLVAFNVGYGTLFYERVLYKTKKWELAIPTYFGGGDVTAAYEDTAGVFVPLLKKTFSSIGIGFGVKYRLLRWLEPKVSVGYRLTFNTDNQVKRAFNRPYYAYGVNILFGELYRMAFKEKKDKKNKDD